MNRKPWYIWLSLIGFVFLWQHSARKVIFVKKDFDLWLKLLGHMFLSVFVYILLPMFMVLFIGTVAEINILARTVINNIALIYIYLMGVFITYKLYKWSASNIQ